MPSRYEFSLVRGHTFRRRSIGFLSETQETSDIDALEAFESLNEKDDRLVRSRFDHWLERNVFRKYFHGWDDEAYKQCFVFKWEKRHIPQRLYGFLLHPLPKTDLSFETCCLVYFDTKDELTDYTLLDRINVLRGNIDVIEAISGTYPELRSNSKWKH